MTTTSPTSVTTSITEKSTSFVRRTNIVIIGCGCYTQCYHIPHLYMNDNVNILALIDMNKHPKSNNNNVDLVSLYGLSIQYTKHKQRIPTFRTINEFLLDPISKYMDGIIIATPHDSHYMIGEMILKEGMKRIQLAIKQQEQQQENWQNSNATSINSYQMFLLRPITILMESPMTTSVLQAKQLNESVQLYHNQLNQYYNADTNHNICRFYMNHSANYTLEAYQMKQSMHLVGKIRHIHLSFVSFDDPNNNVGWNVATDSEMIGNNGYCWGQESLHMLSFLYYICPNITPQTLYCIMNYSDITDDDVSHSVSIQCNDNTITFNMNGTTLYPDNKQHSEPPIAKYIRIKIYGSNGTMIYAGYDDNIYSGKCTFHSMPHNGIITDITKTFTFEELVSNDGSIGPQSLQTFLYATSSIHHNDINVDPAKTMENENNDAQQLEQEEVVVEEETNSRKQHRINEYITQNNCPASSSIGYKTIKTINAMYQSHHAKQVVTI